jgi:hypothetical protein
MEGDSFRNWDKEFAGYVGIKRDSPPELAPYQGREVHPHSTLGRKNYY